MTPTISVAGLTRRYRGQLALDDVTFNVQGASITGLLGRNGAGKTTLLRIIAGHEFASAGRVAVLAWTPWPARCSTTGWSLSRPSIPARCCSLLT